MIDSLFSLGVLAVIALACLGLGRPIALALRGGNDDTLANVVWSMALGLVVAGMMLTMAGLLGLLDATAIRSATGAAALLGVVPLWRARHAMRGRFSGQAAVLVRANSGPSPASASGAQVLAAGLLRSETPRSQTQPSKWLLRGLLCLAAVAAAASLASALAPATAGDALCYHLELPKRFLQSGSLDFLPYHENSTFPLLAEMWFLWAIALDGTLIGGGVAAQLVHFGVGILFAGAATLLARPVLGRGWSCIVGCLVLIVPGVTNQMTAPLNDVSLALFTTLALCAWREATGNASLGQMLVPKQQVTEVPYYELVPDCARGELRLYVLSGVALGAALGIKFLAMVFAAAVGVSIAWDIWRRREFRTQLLAGAAVVAVVSVSLGGVWYVRSAWHRGNPVYPFFGGVLGGDGPEAFRESKTPLANHAFDVAAAPWQVTMQPDRFGGRGHQLGPLFLMLLPGLALSRRLRGLGPLLLTTAAYVALWYLLRQNLRFLLPIVPLLATAAVWVWMETARAPRVPATAIRFACAAMAAFIAAIPLYRAREHWQVALGLEPREAWLARHDCSFVAAAFSRAHMPRDAKILSQDYRAYYFDCDVVRENVYRRRNPSLASSSTSAALCARLRDDGFTHVLLSLDATADQPRPAKSNVSRLLGPAVDAELESEDTLLDFAATDPGGTRRRYVLRQLGAAPGSTATMR